MKCRQTKIFTGDGGKKEMQIVWFGRTFDTSELIYASNATYCSETTICGDVKLHSKDENYVDRQDAVASSLSQRLSVIRGELWYSVNTGLPLADKVISKGIIDASIASIITEHPDVISINTFKSSISNHAYACDVSIASRFGELVITV